MKNEELVIGGVVQLENGLELNIKNKMGEFFIASNNKDKTDLDDYIISVCSDNASKTYLQIEGRSRAGILSGRLNGICNLTSLISEALNMKGLNYKYFSTPEDKFLLLYKNDLITVDLYIYVLNDNRIYLRIPFPFRVESRIFAVMSLFVSQYNQNKAFCTLRLSNAGVLSMEYTYLCLANENFNVNLLERYMSIIVKAAMEIYDELKGLCEETNNITAMEKRLYRNLLEQNLNNLYGKHSKEIVYGINELRKHLNDPTDAIKDRIGKQVSLYFQYGEDNEELNELEDYMWEEIDEMLDGIVNGPSKIMSFEEFMKSRSAKSTNTLYEEDKKASEIDKKERILPFIMDFYEDDGSSD